MNLDGLLLCRKLSFHTAPRILSGGLLRNRQHSGKYNKAQKKSPIRFSGQDSCVKRRLPTLPLAQYHRRDEA